MIAPLQVIILLLIVAAFSSAPQRPPVAFSASMVIVLVVLGHCALLFRAKRRFHRMSRDLQSGLLSPTDMNMAIPKTVRQLMAMNTMLLAADLWLFGFGWLVKFHWNLGRIPLLSSTIWLAAPVMTWLAIWWLEYPLEIQIHRQTLATQGDEEPSTGFPTHPLPSRFQYVNMQFRHGLSLLLVLLAVDLLTIPLTALMNEWNLGYWSAIASVLPVLVLLLVLPTIIVHYWRTTPLPGGPLRTRLESLARCNKVGFIDIRVWHTYYRIPNAAVLGLLAWTRYFLLTDLLLERLEPRQVEAVFAHEVGHGHHRHIWWYLLTFLAADLLGTGISLWAGNVWSLSDNTVMLVNFSIVGVLVIFGFSRVSRMCEHQADWFAARHIATVVAATTTPLMEGAAAYPASTMDGHRQTVTLVNPDDPTPETPAQAGARIFSESLSTLVGMANRPRDRAGWMHPSMRDRVNLLAAMAESQYLQLRFNRRINAMRIGIVIAAVAGAALTFWAARG